MGRPKKTENNIENNNSENLKIHEELAKEGTSIFRLENYKVEDVEYWISTGSLILDASITNSYINKDGEFLGGFYPKGILEISALSSVGKSALAGQLLRNAQLMGAVCAFIDAENAVNLPFFQQCGVDFSPQKLIYSKERVAENIFVLIEKLIEKIQNSKNPKRLGLIVVDSLAAMITKDELELKYETSGYRTQLARQLSFGLKRIAPILEDSNIGLVFTNQLRYNLKAQPFQDPWITVGGAAMSFYADMRWRLVKGKKIINAKKQQVGSIIKVKFIKNRFGPPPNDNDVYFYFGRGIDNDGTIYNFLKERKLIVARKPNLTINIPGLESEKLEIKNWKKWLNEDANKRKLVEKAILDEIRINLNYDEFSEEFDTIDDDEDSEIDTSNDEDIMSKLIESN